ncbi:phytoene desaturase [Metabacillus crassostreae]|uniref:phytoene desaturase family protein n=1 Tax=Metabacillus crassostreae TaxID=929098 RepID=UPI00195B228A|nr:phytoene desaturase family protein [Metabacillus crassostreae]MBM7604129.1 phytoene desaturase [Metabacillus crassostreae]
MRSVVVGGGIGGLVSALLLNKKGYDVTILEQRDRLGGRLSYVEQDDFKIDEGPTIVLLPHMLTSILQEAGVPPEKYELIQIDPLYSIHFKDGSTYEKYTDRSKQLNELERLYPNEKQGFIKFMSDMDIRFEQGMSSFIKRSFSSKRDFWTKKNIKTLVKLKAYRTVYQSLKTYFQEENMRLAYSLQSLYIGGNPYESPALYSLISYSEHKHGIYYLKGGYAHLVDVLKEELDRRGIKVQLNSKVTSLSTEGDKATGLYVNDEYVSADQIILNGDFPVMSKLLDTKKPPEDKYTPSSSCVLLYFGLDKVYENTPVHQFFMSGDFANHMKEVFEKKVVPSDPSFYSFHPSVIDSSLAPDGKGVLYTLVPVPSGTHINWSNQEDFIEKIIDELEERGFPNLRNHIVWKKVKKPNMAEKEGLFQGGSFGIAPILFQSGVFRPQAKPSSYKNVYAVGASVHPGGGIPIVMQGAKIMVDAVQNDHKQEAEKWLI